MAMAKLRHRARAVKRKQSKPIDKRSAAPNLDDAEEAFAGFAALPPPKQWRDILEVAPTGRPGYR